MPARGGFLAVLCCTVVGCAALPAVPPVAPPPPSSAAVGGTQIVAIAAPAAAHPTLFDFLGITPVCGVVQQEVKHKLAFFGTYFPFLEPKPPLLPLTDPANLASPIPAVAAAAEIKAQQDAAPQKIKALKYLATIGCGGCYPGVEEAILAALDDCTEEVRFAAVNAVLATAGSPCVHCNNKACCSPAIRKRLLEIVNEACPCPVEPSARVRRVARLALSACGAPSPIDPVPVVPTEVIPDELVPGTIPPGEFIPPPPPPPAMATPETEQWSDATPVRRRSKLGGEPRIADNQSLESKSSTATGEIVAVSHEESHQDQEADLETLHAYYLANQDRYRTASRVRWEEIRLEISQVASTADAYAVMSYVRDRALGRRSIAPASYRPSMLAVKRHDWTTREQVLPETVGTAVFSQPVGVVSPILRANATLVLVRVLEVEKPRQRLFEETIEEVHRDWAAETTADRKAGSSTSPQVMEGEGVPSRATSNGPLEGATRDATAVNPFAIQEEKVQESGN